MAGPRDCDGRGYDFIIPRRERDTSYSPCVPSVATEFVQINPLFSTLHLDSNDWVALRTPEGLDWTQSWSRMFVTQPPIGNKTIGGLLRHKRKTDSQLETVRRYLETNLWVKGYTFSSNIFRDSIEKKDKQSADAATTGKD